MTSEGAREINRIMAAMLRREQRLRALRRSAAGGCCASCVHGAAYTDLAVRQDRAGKWLATMLRKRGGPADENFARTVEMGAWP